MAPKRKAVGLASFVSFLSQPEVLPPREPASKGLIATSVTIVSKPADEVTLSEERPAKRRKETGILGPGYEEYDATGLVPCYQKMSEVPPQLKKYFAQRKRYFSLYADGCLLDEEGWYSITPERIADQIADRCRCDTILDAFCGVGGNAIAFAKTCERVIALDISPTRLALARHNAVLYGVQDRIEFILCDYLAFARSYSRFPVHRRNIEVVFLSPPWGGPEYISSPTKTTSRVAASENAAPDDGNSHHVFSLQNVLPIPGDELFALTRMITRNVAYFLPRNVDLEQVASLASSAASLSEKVEVEEEWMGDKLKAVTCYYGGLAVGQEHLF